MRAALLALLVVLGLAALAFVQRDKILQITGVDPASLPPLPIELPVGAPTLGLGGKAAPTLAELALDDEACVERYGAGHFADATGTCYAACPKGFERVPSLLASETCVRVETQAAHEYTPGLNEPAKNAGPLCPNNGMPYPDGSCYECPSGSVRAVYGAVGATACRAETRFLRARAQGEQCPYENSRPDSETSRCWACPEAFSPPTDGDGKVLNLKVCIRDGGCAAIPSIEGHGTAARLGDSGRCVSCPVGFTLPASEEDARCSKEHRATPDEAGPI